MIEPSPRPGRRARPFFLLAAFALLFGAACGGSATADPDYAVSAERNYELGKEKLDEEEWKQAAKYFEFVKARFPYSRYAVLAEIGIAEAQQGVGNPRTAIESYRSFLKLHPTHELSRNGYVAHKMGGAYLDMLPDDWWLVPPSYERDQTAAMEGHRHLSRFVRQYPDSPYLDDAREMLAKLNLHLARHEWYVAKFYWDRDEPMGTVIRLRRLLGRHAGTELDGDALWLLGRAYVEVNMYERARSTWERLIEEHPDHDKIEAAQKSLARLPAKRKGEAARETRDG